jgi:uncharacterized protein
MRKLLLLFAVGLALLWWFGKGRRKTQVRKADPVSPATPATTPRPMLSCCRCGLHLPQDDAFLDDSGRVYCSLEHRRLGPGAGPAS